MSRGGRADVALLRRAVAQIEAKAGFSSASRARPARRMAVARAFDPALGGGLAEDGLHEIAPAEPQDGPAAMGFALALAARFLDLRPASALMIGESFASLEAGALYGPGLVAHGLPLSRLVFVSAPDANAAFWATEEALKSGAPAAVVVEVWNLRSYGLMASRRLLIAARKGGTPALLVLAGGYGQADKLSTAATTRFEIAAAPSAKSPAAAGRDLPGPFACTARLVKARSAGAVDRPSTDGRSGDRPMDRGGGLSEAALQADRDQRSRLQNHDYWRDATRAVRLVWRNEERCFDDPAISLALASASGDRPGAASERR